MAPSSAYAHLAALRERRPVLMDGAVGAELVRRGVRWRKHGLLTDADAVRQAHVDYIQAGADLIRTNTLGLNHRIYLNVFKNRHHMRHIGAPDLETLAPRLVRRAAEVAREARDQAGRINVPVAGVISPLEHVFRPDLAPDEETARREHAELAGALADGGVDFLYVDAMTTHRETRGAGAAARQTRLPFWAAFAVDERGELLSHEPLAEAIETAVDAGAEAVILTGAPVEDLALALRNVGRGLPVPVGAAPMCGRFDPPTWKFDFHPRFGEAPSPEQFADAVRGALPDDVAVVGAWCGAAPEHVAALARIWTRARVADR